MCKTFLATILVILETCLLAGCKFDNNLLPPITPAIPREPDERWQETIAFPAPEDKWHVIEFQMVEHTLFVHHEVKNFPVSHKLEFSGIANDGRSVSWLISREFNQIESNLPSTNRYGNSRLPSPFEGLVYEVQLVQITDPDDGFTRLWCFIIPQFDFGD